MWYDIMIIHLIHLPVYAKGVPLTMRIAIVDDVCDERRTLRRQLENALRRRRVQAEILECGSSEEFIRASKQQRFEAAFMDIYMPGASGIEATKELRKWDRDCLIVFTTVSKDHALEGFQVRAMQYLVKPFAERDIDALTDELLARMPRCDKYMTVKMGGDSIRLLYSNIVYAEHFSHMIYIHTTAQKVLATRQPFREFTAPLKDDARFFICNRGMVVNMEHASDFEDACFVMDDGSCIFVSRELVKTARHAFMEFLLQRRH